MESTLLKQLDDSINVDVVLATFNGAVYLREQLDSLVNQVSVKINLYVSDDGSHDLTKQILSDYSTKFQKVTFFEGPGKGPAANFFFLLRQTNESYVALADQDDIWDRHHLINSIKSLDNFTHIPALRFSATREFGDSTRVKFWPVDANLPDLERLLFQNLARGCTMVLNKNAVRLINSYEPKFAVMHDWWILLQVRVRGLVIYSNIPEVNYRLHSSNFIGRSRKTHFLNFKQIQKKLFSAIDQARELYQVNKLTVSVDTGRTLSLVTQIPNLSLSQKVSLILLGRRRYRRGFFEEIAFRVFLVTLPNKK